MCHLLLLMPLLGIPLFWLIPLGYALPSYVAIVMISALLYWLITRAMRQPVQDGFQSLVGAQAEVVSTSGTDRSAGYLVRAQGEGELWSACSIDTLLPGELVNIVAVKGIGMVVERPGHSPASSAIGTGKTKNFGAKTNERHCH